MTFTLAELAARVGGEVAGDGAIELERVAPLESGGPGDVSFYSSKKYRQVFEASQASAVVVAQDEDVPPGRAVLRARNASLAFAKISTLFHPPALAKPGVAEQAFVHPSAHVDPSAELLPFVFVGPEAVVGARCILHPGAYLGAGARLGEDCVLWPNAVVRERCTLGNRVVLAPGSVVGADGFGFTLDMEGEGGSGPRHYKVPQVGTVVVEDDVEFGANACADRATLGITRIGRGTKIDNLVQVGHNVEVGPLCILCGQVGIAGSSKLGTGVIAAGQVGIAGHLTVKDGARLGAQCGIMSDVEPGVTLMGSPAMQKGEYLRVEVAMRRLPELMKRVRELEKKLERLEGRP